MTAFTFIPVINNFVSPKRTDQMFLVDWFWDILSTLGSKKFNQRNMAKGCKTSITGTGFRGQDYAFTYAQVRKIDSDDTDVSWKYALSN